MELEPRRFEVVPLTKIAPLLDTRAGNERRKTPHPEKILSVSFHESLATTRSLLFSGAGFQVASALTIEQAIELCKTETFQLVVIGHSLPAKDKKSLLKQIRSSCPVPVLALYHRAERKLEGADYTLDSTEGPVALLEMVNRIVRGTQTDH
jgi:DNA-binding response OmpR family regulator